MKLDPNRSIRDQLLESFQAYVVLCAAAYDKSTTATNLEKYTNAVDKYIEYLMNYLNKDLRMLTEREYELRRMLEIAEAVDRIRDNYPAKFTNTVIEPM